ncbi:putative high-affinity nicotinic acid transporter [Clavispora lusitaniae]|uniref:High-affinity nicotinic acid transporter n=1 Tax=Clavispora lusitaniae TaxID=36911 RepID=A0AA91Q3C7_CLALS|nr:putative high-affinity nicotinic acid transporter [Clavispora lusitaniae]
MQEKDTKTLNNTLEVEVSEGQIESVEEPFDVKAERRLLQKFDWKIMPLFCAAYFFSALDRSNIGNANVAGMAKDLNLTSHQYSNAVSLVYATYLPVMLPGVWLMRKFNKPRYYMGGMIICWSIISIFTLFVRSYGSLVAMRLLLGFFEGSFFSCMTLIATDYYLPDEIGRRTSYYFVASALSSSFGGLIATGITKIPKGALKPWHYLYLIEGLLSLVCGICVLVFLPDSPVEMIHSQEEMIVYKSRSERRKTYDGSSHFDKKEFISAFDFKIACSVVIQFCQDVCLYGFSTFLPIILKSGLGFDSLKAQYLTVPVYIFAGLIYLFFAEISDRTKIRGPIIVFSNIFGIAGYIILLCVDKAGVKYFACYLICFSLYIGTGVNESWIASNTAPSFKRGTSIAINQSLGNISGAISPQVYVHPPDYELGHKFTLGCLCVSSAVSIICTLYLKRKNETHQKILDSGVDDRKQARKTGDDSPEFRFIL